MNTSALADELNNLLATETRSLLRHLGEAQPHVTPTTYRLWHEIEAMAQTSAAHADRLAALLAQLDLPAGIASFPSSVADFHYVTIPSILPSLIAAKQRQIDAYQRAVGHADGNVHITAELQSLLAENQQSLTRLEEMQRTA